MGWLFLIGIGVAILFILYAFYLIATDERLEKPAPQGKKK